MRTSVALLAFLFVSLHLAGCESNISCQSGPKHGTQCYGPGQQTGLKNDPTVNNVAPMAPPPSR